MSMIEALLRERDLPEVLMSANGVKAFDAVSWRQRREEIKELLFREFAGYPCTPPDEVEGFVTRRDEEAYGDKAVTEWLEIRCRSASSYFAFPCTFTLPKGIDNPPVFIHFSFTPMIADGLAEEIIDYGYGIANIYYQDVVPDKEDGFLNGAARLCPRNPYDSWGKIGMWAWSASRVLDYLLTRDDFDHARVGVSGHSRLGKTSLLAGAFDELFSFIFANNSGAGGAALFRGKTGELLADLSRPEISYWYCGNLWQYVKHPERLPFDQHFLLALCAPRHLYVSSASLDAWADPVSEFLGCAAASPVYEMLGADGFIVPGRLPEAGEAFHEGRIGYHLRKGSHHLGRFDWQQAIAYRNRHQI